MVRFVALSSIDSSVAACTLTPVWPFTMPEVAVMIVAAPTKGGGIVTAAPSPVVGPTLTIVESAELHVAVVVRFCVVPSVYLPVAVNCRYVPGFIVGLAGVTVMDVRVAAETCRVVAPLTLPEAAVIVVDPCALVVARPLLAITATVVDDEVQVAVLVRSIMDPSE